MAELKKTASIVGVVVMSRPFTTSLKLPLRVRLRPIQQAILNKLIPRLETFRPPQTKFDSVLAIRRTHRATTAAAAFLAPAVVPLRIKKTVNAFSVNCDAFNDSTASYRYDTHRRSRSR